MAVPVRPRVLPADERRRQLLDAARAVLIEKGDRATVADFTERAGLAKGSFYLHFETKHDVVAALRLELLEGYYGEFAKVVSATQPEDLWVVIETGIGPVVDFLASDLHDVVFNTGPERARAHEIVVDGYASLIERGVDAGVFDVDDPYWTAVMLVGALNFAVRYARDVDRFDREGIIASITELTRRALHVADRRRITASSSSTPS
jgi:AcrR family transcriptional regulator